MATFPSFFLSKLRRHPLGFSALGSLFLLGLLGSSACSSDGETADDGAATGGTVAGSGGSTTGSGGAPGEDDVDPPSEPVSPFIAIDQFGYLEDSEKIAVLRSPETGFDAAESFAPGANYQLIDASTKAVVFEAAPVAWNGGAVHDQSGDVAWHFDFSSVTAPGVYYVLDVTNGVRSDLFRVAADVYAEPLRHALRTFFYQRAGFAKEAAFAGDDWADAASHVGPLQDKNARRYDAPTDASTERDLSGGWYDAGDYNKYTAWTGDYVAAMLRAYEENPAAFNDATNIPESGNGTPDILDEARFGLDHLVRLQNEDGSVLSIVSLAHASPPSAATDPSLYGPASTNATLRAALAYSAGARVFADLDATFAADLKERAVAAWGWADANPAVVFRNNEGAAVGIGAGQQEVDANTLAVYKNCVAVELYRLTGDATYKDFFDDNFDAEAYGPINYYVAAWDMRYHDYYLDYAALPDADGTVKSTFLDRFLSGMDSDDNFGMLTLNADPYLAYVKTSDYTWGSNSHKSNIGTLFYSFAQRNLDAAKTADARRAAERYVHYIHGVNPLGLVYLSNMNEYGAHASVSQFYHTWFGEGTAWDEVGVSTHGPAPGFLVGGANPYYDWDACCTAGTCTDNGCGNAPPSPPFGQPAQKSYSNFNTNWPLNSWAVTENSNGYQIAYIRLLSKFVR